MSGGIGNVSKGRIYLTIALLANISRKTRPYYTQPLLPEMILPHDAARPIKII